MRSPDGYRVHACKNSENRGISNFLASDFTSLPTKIKPGLGFYRRDDWVNNQWILEGFLNGWVTKNSLRGFYTVSKARENESYTILCSFRWQRSRDQPTPTWYTFTISLSCNNEGERERDVESFLRSVYNVDLDPGGSYRKSSPPSNRTNNAITFGIVSAKCHKP